MNKTTEALKLAEEALDIAANKPMWDGKKTRSALAAIREELSDHSGDDYENMTDDELADLQFTRAIAREALAQPVKQEPVAWHHPECEGECLACLIERCVKDSYGKQCLEYMLRHINAAQVSAKREWVELTDDEIGAVMDFGYATDSELENAHAVIAAFKEKNK